MSICYGFIKGALMFLIMCYCWF